MKDIKGNKLARAFLTTSAIFVLCAPLTLQGVEPNTRTFTAGQSTKLQGTVLSRDGATLKVKGDDDAIGTVDLTAETKIQLKKGGIFRRKAAMDQAALVPGLHVEVDGKGNEKGDLVAEKVVFDPNSMRASKQIDARVSPVEAAERGLEGRTGQLEGRAGQIEGRQGQLEDAQKQTNLQVGQVQTQVGQVRDSADKANQGVGEANTRIGNLDNYEPKDSVTVYFKINSATLSPEAKKDLDDLAQKALAQKGYVVEVAGFADTTGNISLNQELSQRRADAVIRYLQQQGNIPLHRILAPAGMGTSHEAADNKTAAGRKLNRRVEVKVLVNQGVVSGLSGAGGNAAGSSAGSTTTPPATPTPRPDAPPSH